jgi:DNA polymerase
MIFIDFEVFKYDWLCVIVNMSKSEEKIIINDSEELKNYYEENINEIWIGYNIKHYDQYILKAAILKMNVYDI